MSFAGASAIVTGGGSGIGRALAEGLAARGARVWVADLDGGRAEHVAAAIGREARAVALDVRDAPAVAALVARVDREHGRLDYLFNNAGVGVGGNAEDLVVDHWLRVLDVNVKGIVHGVAAAYPLMAARRRGHIVNTASLAGLVPCPLLTPYATAKHAVVGLSTSLAIEARSRGVKVTVLCPAAVETPLLDSKGPGDLPRPAWQPDYRRFLTRLAGPPVSPEGFAREALDGVARGAGVVVVPARARLVHLLGRLLPGLLAGVAAKAVEEERRAPARADVTVA